MRFFDTNMLVYAATNQEPQKGDIARELIQHALEVNHDGVISVQVMTEFSNVMKTRFNAPATEIDEWISQFYPLRVTEVTMDVVRTALYVKEEYGIQFYDAEILAAAEESRCRKVLSEDLSSTQDYGGISVHNPFSDN